MNIWDTLHTCTQSPVEIVNCYRMVLFVTFFKILAANDITITCISNQYVANVSVNKNLKADDI